MSKETLQEIFQNLVVKSLEQVYQVAQTYSPKIVLAVLILFVGWLSAVILKKVVSKLLKAFGFDVLCEKFGFQSILAKGGITKRPSLLIGVFFFWLIIFSTLVMIFETLNFEVVSSLLKQAVFYLPKIFVALVLVALGTFLSGFAARFVDSTARLANIPFHEALSKIARYGVIGFSLMMALEQLDVATSIVVQSFIIIFGVIPVLITLFLLVGGRDVIACILAGRMLSGEYEKGDEIEMDTVSGEIESIGFIATKLKSKDQEISVPNTELVRKTVKRKKKTGAVV